MMRHAQYSFTEVTKTRIVIRDIGHDCGFPSITNDAEWVVEQIAKQLGDRRLFYVDSTGRTDELLVENGEFVGFNVL